jgi:hypothetical protein
LLIRRVVDLKGNTRLYPLAVYIHILSIALLIKKRVRCAPHYRSWRPHSKVF